MKILSLKQVKIVLKLLCQRPNKKNLCKIWHKPFVAAAWRVLGEEPHTFGKQIGSWESVDKEVQVAFNSFLASYLCFFLPKLQKHLIK